MGATKRIRKISVCKDGFAGMALLTGEISGVYS